MTALYGPANGRWRGAKAGYRAKHYRVYRRRGKAFGCSRCGLSDPDRRYHWANLTGHYGDAEDYASMCCSCHYWYDRFRRRA